MFEQDIDYDDYENFDWTDIQEEMDEALLWDL